MYCMEHMPNGSKGSHKRGKDRYIDDDGEFVSEKPLNKKGVHTLTNVQYEQVRKWVLQCSKVAIPWRKKYQAYVNGFKSSSRKRKGNSPMSFIPWLRQQLENSEMSVIKRLADGPHFQATSYNSYQASGYVFSTAEWEINKTTQNSGVKMNAMTSFRSSAKDRNLVDEEATYYGVIRQILELNYFDFTQTVFYCDWVRIEDKANGCYFDPDINLVFVNFSKFRRSSKFEDEPFILASQASQVFYCKDPTRSDWNVVLDAPKRLTRDMDAYEDPLTFESRVPREFLHTSHLEDVGEIGADCVPNNSRILKKKNDE
ncbi:hypothetical protein IFM89_016170 [Coptis chinensis]|uniref:DUF4216 domain-containing protein n=1 Tax=Coptis chinensis TaxID=261450 RepID=A0A835GYE1_9MAGN|nr:hypothetical protein IFM89_016170 [Coptis chinensis]